MSQGTLWVIGAAGDVGQGIVSAALESGRRVVASGRDTGRLAALKARHDSASLACVAGDLATEAGAELLWDAAIAAHGSIDDIVISVNAPNSVQPLAEWHSDDLGAVLTGNVLTHFIAAKTYLPRLPQYGLLIGIGGGTADFIFPNMAPVSMGQAALRMLYRGLAKETMSGAQSRELMIISMVAGASNRDTAQPAWITDSEVGRHVCAILDAPEKFPKPILHLRSRDQVGHPEVET